MSEFKIIETQEQLDAIIGERIARAEKKTAEKFADYEEIKKQNEDYASQISALKQSMESQSETATANNEKIANLEKQVESYATAAVKTRVALESGLPYELADKLSGTTEDEIRADAQTMAKYMVNQRAPIGSNEPDIEKGDPKRASLMALAQKIGKE